MSIISIERRWKEIVNTIEDIERNLKKCCEDELIWREIYRNVVGRGLRLFRWLLEITRKRFGKIEEPRVVYFTTSLVRLIRSFEAGLSEN